MPALADLQDLAGRISAALAAAAVPHAVSGAIAMAAHGFVRGTRDIDLLVVVPALRLPEVFSIARRFGFEGEDRALIESWRAQSVAELKAGPASLEILAPVLPYHHEVLRRAVVIAVEGTGVPFVSVEDLVVLKMLWLRDKDRGDLRALLAVRKGSLDEDYVRRTMASLIPEGNFRFAEFARMLAEAGSGGRSA